MTHRRSAVLAVSLLLLTACGDDTDDQLDALRKDEMVHVAPEGAKLADPTIEKGSTDPATADWISVSRDVIFNASPIDVVRFYADQLSERDWFEISVRCVDEGGPSDQYFLDAIKVVEGRARFFALIIHLDENEDSSVGDLAVSSPPNADAGIPPINEASPADLECLDAA